MDYDPCANFGDYSLSSFGRTAFIMFLNFCDNVTLTIISVIPKSFSIPSLNTLGSFVFELSCGQTNRQNHTQTDADDRLTHSRDYRRCE